jgi:hypothetical protein
MFTESGQEELVGDDHPFYHQGPLAAIDLILVEFAACHTTYQDIHDAKVHTQMHNDLV